MLRSAQHDMVKLFKIFITAFSEIEKYKNALESAFLLSTGDDVSARCVL